jgi:hypothetical protein
MSDSLDYDGFYRLLADCVSARKTCTIFGRTDANNSVIIGLDSGRIACLRCGSKKGMDVVAALRGMHSGTFRVDDVLIELHSAPPPPTADLMAALHPTIAPSQPQPAAGAAPGKVEPTREAIMLCEMLARYIGPVAPVLCQEQIGAIGGLHHREQLDQVLGRLAQEIDDASEASDFVSAANREIAPLLSPAPSGASWTTAPRDHGLAFDPGAAGTALCGIVADYLGPIAPIVCEEKIAEVGGLRGPNELELAIRNIAGEIGDMAEAERFIAQVRAALDAVLK